LATPEIRPIVEDHKSLLHGTGRYQVNPAPAPIKKGIPSPRSPMGHIYVSRP
jgi:hypothetical protein